MNKTNSTTRGNKLERIGDRRKTKMIWIQDKKGRHKRTFQSNEKKLYQPIGGECRKSYQQPDDKETKQFRTKYGNEENIIEKLNG